MHRARTIPESLFWDRIKSLMDAGVDIDALPGHLEIRDVMRLPVERLRIISEANAATQAASAL